MPSRRSADGTSRSSSGSSFHSTGGTKRDQEMSLNLYSRDNGHWGIMTYVSDQDRGKIFHARSDEHRDQDKFYYNEREQAIESQSSLGRSRVACMSPRERARAESHIREYGSREENMPRRSQNTNCQDFCTGAMGYMERNGSLRPGHQQYFEAQRGRNGTDIVESLKRDGRSWIPAPLKRIDTPDAGWSTLIETKQPSKLNIGAFERTLDIQKGRGRGKK